MHNNEDNEFNPLSLWPQYGCHDVVDTSNATVQVWRYSNLVPRVFLRKGVKDIDENQAFCGLVSSSLSG